MVAKAAPTVAQPELEPEEIEDNEINHVPNVNKLDVDIGFKAPAQTLGNVMQAYQDVDPNSIHKESPRPESPNTTQEQFLQEWKNEAGN